MTATPGGAAAPPAGPGRPVPAGDTAIAAGVLVLAAVVYWQAAEIPVSPIFARVGPTVVPYLVAVVLAMLGAALLVAALRGGWQPDEERQTAPDRAALAWVVAGLALNVLLIGPLGFTLASTLMFTCIARGFRSRRTLRDAATGLILAALAYFGFAKLLGINIGAGIVERAVQAALGG